MSSKDLGTADLSPLRDLPDAILAGIARVILQHSIMENLLAHCTYLLVGVDAEIGRMAVKTGRPYERLALIVNLAKQRNLKPPPTTRLNQEIRKVSEIRDKLAHGVFFEHPKTGGVMLRVTTGDWMPKGSHKGYSRAVMPSGQDVTEEALAALVETYAAINDALRGFHRAIALLTQQQ